MNLNEILAVNEGGIASHFFLNPAVFAAGQRTLDKNFSCKSVNAVSDGLGFKDKNISAMK